MSRLPTPRRRFGGIPVLTLLIVLAVLYALSRIQPRAPQQGKENVPAAR